MTYQPEGHAIGYLVWHLTLKWRAEMGRMLAPLGLTATQYSVLASLYALVRTGVEPSQRELADFSGLEPMHVSKVVRALERDSLVERHESASDPRAFRLTLTEHGVEVLTQAIGMVRQQEARRLMALGEPVEVQAAQLSAMLRTLLVATNSVDEANALLASDDVGA